MENFTIEHTDLGTFFEKCNNRDVSFDLKYFKTHNKVPLSVNVFCLWAAEFGNLDNYDFQSFHKKHLIKLNMLIYFKTSNN